uniref:Uncharacterized protein n=1 Tax=Arundo donax TaxID=35708 RepID=A0A0A9FCK8_ARUDO
MVARPQSSKTFCSGVLSLEDLLLKELSRPSELLLCVFRGMSS